MNVFINTAQIYSRHRLITDLSTLNRRHGMLDKTFHTYIQLKPFLFRSKNMIFNLSEQSEGLQDSPSHLPLPLLPLSPLSSFLRITRYMKQGEL